MPRPGVLDRAARWLYYRCTGKRVKDTLDEKTVKAAILMKKTIVGIISFALVIALSCCDTGSGGNGDEPDYYIFDSFENLSGGDILVAESNEVWKDIHEIWGGQSAAVESSEAHTAHGSKSISIGIDLTIVDGGNNSHNIGHDAVMDTGIIPSFQSKLNQVRSVVIDYFWSPDEASTVSDPNQLTVYLDIRGESIGLGRIGLWAGTASITDADTKLMMEVPLDEGDDPAAMDNAINLWVFQIFFNGDGSVEDGHTLIGDLYIDNIRFRDADGKYIEP